MNGRKEKEKRKAKLLKMKMKILASGVEAEARWDEVRILLSVRYKWGIKVR